MQISCLLNGALAPQITSLLSLSDLQGSRFSGSLERVRLSGSNTLSSSHRHLTLSAFSNRTKYNSAKDITLSPRCIVLRSVADGDKVIVDTASQEPLLPGDGNTRNTSESHSSQDNNTASAVIRPQPPQDLQNLQQQQKIPHVKRSSSNGSSSSKFPPGKRKLFDKKSQNSGDRKYSNDREGGSFTKRYSSSEQRIPRMSAEDERAAHIDGYFLKRLQYDGFLDEDGMPTALGLRVEADKDACYLHLSINKMLSMNRRHQTVLAVVRDVGHLMGPVNICTAMHRLGKLVRAARSQLSHDCLPSVLADKNYKKLLNLTLELLPEFTPRAIANYMWGMAALGDMVNKHVMEQLGDSLLQFGPNMLKTQEVSNVVWALATLELFMPRLLDRMLDSAADRIDNCIPQALSNMTWGCAILRHRHSRFLDAVSRSASSRLSEFGSQTLSNTLWAYSVLGIYPTSLFHAAAEEIVMRFEKQNQREQEGEVLTAPEFQGQEISNILIAFARGSIIHQGLLQAFENELCGVAWVQRGREFYSSVQVPRLQDFTSQALANILWAFASMRWYPARLLPVITEAVGQAVHLMTEQELANSGWAYARFAYHPGRVMASYLQVIEQRVEMFDCQSCTNMLWALAVLKSTHSTAFVKLLHRFMDLERSGEIFGELQYNQLLQAVLLAQFEARGGRVTWRPEVDLPEDVVDKALKAWASQQAGTQLSGFHLDVSQGLKRLGIGHKIEHLVARDLLSIDIAVTNNGRRIAIEVDGPFHFPINARTPLGHTMIRRRLLRAAGWKVVSIPWYEWFAMDSWEARLMYLAAMLAKADASLGEQLKPTVDLLSTEFEPGPGIGADSSIADPSMDPSSPAAAYAALVEDATSSHITASGSFDEGDDGPTLSSDDEDFADKDELKEVLSRGNVQLTSGAIRRLQSMGLSKEVKQLRDAQAARRLTEAGKNPVGGPNNEVGGWNNNTFDARTMPSARESSRTSGSGKFTQNQNVSENDAGALLPKPSFIYAQRHMDPNNRGGARFQPTFTDRKVKPARLGDLAWGMPLEDLQSARSLNLPDNNSSDKGNNAPQNQGRSSSSSSRGRFSSTPGSSASSSIGSVPGSAGAGWAGQKKSGGGRMGQSNEQASLAADAVLNRALHGRSGYPQQVFQVGSNDGDDAMSGNNISEASQSESESES